jgi:heme/copper-type cytochrome/quinol oxidase subunit 2
MFDALLYLSAYYLTLKFVPGAAESNPDRGIYIIVCIGAIFGLLETLLIFILSMLRRPAFPVWYALLILPVLCIAMNAVTWYGCKWIPWFHHSDNFGNPKMDYFMWWGMIMTSFVVGSVTQALADSIRSGGTTGNSTPTGKV